MWERATRETHTLGGFVGAEFPELGDAHMMLLQAPVGAGIPTDAGIRCLAAAQRNARLRNEFQVDDGEPWCGLSLGSGSGTVTLMPAGVALGVLVRRSVKVGGSGQAGR
jgi:hypothetical protein